MVKTQHCVRARDRVRPESVMSVVTDNSRVRSRISVKLPINTDGGAANGATRLPAIARSHLRLVCSICAHLSRCLPEYVRTALDHKPLRQEDGGYRTSRSFVRPTLGSRPSITPGRTCTDVRPTSCDIRKPAVIPGSAAAG